MESSDVDVWQNCASLLFETEKENEKVMLGLTMEMPYLKMPQFVGWRLQKLYNSNT